MNFKQKKITDNINLLIFDNQHDVASTFLRFEEHYESPKFRGKIFSLNEFKKWYIKNSLKGKETNKFTYYSDWDGFNVPSYVLTPFYKGKFDPLSSKEKKILELFKNTKKPFYIIAVHKRMIHLESLLKHEIAHGLFYTEKEYKNEVLNVLKKFDTENVKRLIHTNEAGYHEAVMDDEVHAYTIASGIKLKTREHQIMKKLLNDLYTKYITNKHTKLPKIV